MGLILSITLQLSICFIMWEYIKSPSICLHNDHKLCLSLIRDSTRHNRQFPSSSPWRPLLVFPTSRTSRRKPRNRSVQVVALVHLRLCYDSSMLIQILHIPFPRRPCFYPQLRSLLVVFHKIRTHPPLSHKTSKEIKQKQSCLTL